MKKPIKYSWMTEAWPALLLIAVVGLSIWSYPQLPERVVTHWDINGQANGWSSRQFQAIFFPALLAGLYLLFNFLPLIDPKRERYQEFSRVYLVMRNLILSVLAVVFFAATFSNLGYPVNIGATVVGSIGLMMIILGNYFGKLKRNWFIGIRTPWTLSSENVWNKTHRLGGRIFVIWGVCLLITPWLMNDAIFIFLFGGLVAMMIGVSAYSYILYRREKMGNKKSSDVL